MLSSLRTACDGLTRLAKGVLGCVVFLIVAITLASVWWRYALDAPLPWPEQVSRILFVWMTFLGAAILYREKLHVAIDMFVLMLPKGPRLAVVWLVELCVLGFNIVLLIYGLKLSLDTLSQTFGALDISPATFYFAAPVASGLMILFFVEWLADPGKRTVTGVSSGL